MDKTKHLKTKYSLARFFLIKSCDSDELRWYLYVKLYAINKNSAFPSFKSFTRDLGWTKYTIIRIVKKLEKKGRLKVKRERGRNNVYDITWYDKVNDKGSSQENLTTSGRETLTTSSKENSTTSSQENLTQTNIDKTINKETNIPPKALPLQLVNYFFELKGWANKDKDFYRKKKIIYARFTRPAKELVYLCDNDLEEAKFCLKKVAEWADSRELDWSIETVFKKWYDIDKLKPKEKKPYHEGNRAFQMSGKWFLLMPNGEKMEFAGNEKEFIYK